MRNHIVSTIVVLFFLILVSVLATDCFGEKYTSGSGYFTISESTLSKVERLERREHYDQIQAMVALGLVKICPQGRAVEIYNYRSGTYRVKFPNSSTIWWTSEKALMNRGEENLVR
jgi:hypothetical protein